MKREVKRGILVGLTIAISQAQLHRSSPAWVTLERLRRAWAFNVPGELDLILDETVAQLDRTMEQERHGQG